MRTRRCDHLCEGPSLRRARELATHGAVKVQASGFEPFSGSQPPLRGWLPEMSCSHHKVFQKGGRRCSISYTRPSVLTYTTPHTYVSKLLEWPGWNCHPRNIYRAMKQGGRGERAKREPKRAEKSPTPPFDDPVFALRWFVPKETNLAVRGIVAHIHISEMLRLAECNSILCWRLVCCLKKRKQVRVSDGQSHTPTGESTGAQELLRP